MNDLNEDIKLLLAQGKKIQAIKLTMDHTNLGLKEAKNYVEEIAKFGHATPPSLKTSPVGDDILEAEAMQFLAKKNKIGAVKRIRELTNWGLKEAKEYVDTIQNRELYNLSSSEMISEETLAFEARQWMQRKNKIMAIKRVRELTGWGLKEAKDFVDKL